MIAARMYKANKVKRYANKHCKEGKTWVVAEERPCFYIILIFNFLKNVFRIYHLSFPLMLLE